MKESVNVWQLDRADPLPADIHSDYDQHSIIQPWSYSVASSAADVHSDKKVALKLKDALV